jgi:rRNA maturation endonuclease Nob1
LGGCCWSPESPERACTSCGHKWRIKRKVYFDESLS